MSIVWTEQTPGTNPGPRLDHSLAYDPDRDVVVLWGGTDGVSTAYNQTWEWDGSIWAQISTVTSPSTARSTIGKLVYDADVGGIIMVVTFDSPAFQETWLYDPVTPTWTLLTTTGSPPAVFAPFVAYYPTINRTVLYGGQAGGCSAATYLFEGATLTWSLFSTANTPSASAQSPLVYDPVRDVILKIDGRCTALNYHDEVWQFDGVDWADVTPGIPRPGARDANAVAYLACLASVALFGGEGPLIGTDDETWTLNGVTDYTLEAPATSPTARCSLAGNNFMSINVGATTDILYGGQDAVGAPNSDTWILSCGEPVQASLAHTFGLGQ